MAACSREETAAGTHREESAYERMGRLHNEGLDYVLARIVAEAPATKSGGRVIPPEEDIRAMCRVKCPWAMNRHKVSCSNRLTVLEYTAKSRR